MAAMLTSETGNTEKVVKYINEARSMGITVLPPDVNSSDVNFTPVGDQIRFGLARHQERGRKHGEGHSARRAKRWDGSPAFSNFASRWIRGC